MQEVASIRAVGQDNLNQALSDYLNDGWELLQVLIMGKVVAGNELSISPNEEYPVFLIIFTRLVAEA